MLRGLHRVAPSAWVICSALVACVCMPLLTIAYRTDVVVRHGFDRLAADGGENMPFSSARRVVR